MDPPPLNRIPVDDDPLPLLPGAKLRLMCSYGGHIMPRPHHNTLIYIGGDTRIVAVDRNTCLKNLSSHLSRTLLNGRPFTLKYLLPNEDLDNLVTVATDEDLQNMIEEHDRHAPSRLRMFLFFNKPQTALSMSSLSLLDADPNSETWFVDALNSSGMLTRGVSDSAAAAVECLVSIDENLEEANNLPPIRVRFDDGGSERVEQDAVVNADRSEEQRKPPLPSQLVQPKTSGGFGLPSPDSVASDSSISSANSFSKIVYYQEQVQAAHVDSKGPVLPSIKSEISDHSRGLLQAGEQVQDLVYTSAQQIDHQNQLPPQPQQQPQQQQQFMYFHHPAGIGQVPMPSYYPVYAPTSQPQLHHPIGQPVYVMPVTPTQPYNMTLQSNISDPNVVASVRPLIPQSGAAPAPYKDGTPPIYPTKSVTATPSIPEVAPSVYKPPVASSPAFVQIPFNQFQQQNVGLPQHIHHPPQPISIAPSATTNYEPEAERVRTGKKPEF
ncbi:hypothetical protein RJT34_04863 [Clitoria ternatea]|uniref:PB1 domain-containing protein n=1 Tax=Clitoria ternatea TaxID=43366 RepID=A0AAN9KMW1_CLITE